MIAEIRLNKRTKTIKVVNRKNNIRLTHTGKIGPQGDQGLKGDAGGFYVKYVLEPVGDTVPDQGEFSLFSPGYMVFNRVDQNAVDLLDYFNSLSATGTLELFVLDDPTKFSICNYARRDWADDSSYSVGHLVNYNTNIYRAIQDHTSSPADEPDSGASWQDMWELLLPSGYAIIFGQTASSYSFQGGETVGISFIPDGEQGPQGPTGESTFVRVHHGSDPDVARPDAVYVEWVGSVAPNNATVEDTWIDTA